MDEHAALSTDAAHPGEVELSAPDRRRFLQLLGASLALAGQGGCRLSQPTEKIVPYVRSPEHLVPGKPLYYASGLTLGGYATGVLVESHLGRPTKIEGNPQHPASLGSTDAQTQAAILSLYDPDRSQVITCAGEVQTWKAFVNEMQAALKDEDGNNGAGLRVLTETVTSPTLARQLNRLLKKYPQARWHSHEPVSRERVYAGAKLAFGEALEPRHDFTKADVIVSLDADFLARGPGHVRYARDFARRRSVPAAAEDDRSRDMNRLYAVESSCTITGAAADHRLAIRPGRIEAMAIHLARRLGMGSDGNATGEINQDGSLSREEKDWLDSAAKDFAAHRAASLVIAGDHQPPEVHALTHALNAKLKNTGKTVEYTDPVAVQTGTQADSLRRLVDDMVAGEVEMLVILGGNPVYNAPADLRFAEALEKVGTSVHLGLNEDETAQRCRWRIPAAHELESWSDARAYDGTATILQPLIDPLYGGKTVHEIAAVLLGDSQQSSHDIVRHFWQENHGGDDFDQFWRRSLHDGVVPDSQFKTRDVTPSSGFIDGFDFSDNPGEMGGVDILFRPDPTIHDGRFANNAWLQELPKPITTLTWDTAALMSRATARRHDLSSQQLVEIEHAGRTLMLPMLIVAGHADNCVTVHLGHGRKAGGQLATGSTFNAFDLRTSESPWIVHGATLHPTSRRYRLARTQSHHRMEGRDLIRRVTLEEFKHDPHAGPDHGAHHPVDSDLTLYDSSQPAREEEYAWGMSINLTTCIGCSACVVACQAENNIPVVGKEEVLRGREMHWIRVDEYVDEAPEGPQALHQPVTCMHCENAPCEVVCPVAATVHSDEGLNEMVYNRCVGTRYCSNNCPYKVRRFNFLQYADEQTPVLKLLRNPDVTVRMRGVMEKCTYCVQRINAARIEAKKGNRRIADGDVVTACQQACPTQAIVFGDTADPESRVAQAKSQPHDYGLLTELNTRPRTTYLARVINPADKSG